MGEVFRPENSLPRKMLERMAVAKAAMEAGELSMGKVAYSGLLLSQLNHTTARIWGRFFESSVEKPSVIQAAFCAPPSPASSDPVSPIMIGLLGATDRSC